jgi:hypothetical protein
MRWGRVLFTVRLEIVVRAPRLHTVVGGTPDSGYRQLPWVLVVQKFCIQNKILVLEKYLFYMIMRVM